MQVGNLLQRLDLNFLELIKALLGLVAPELAFKGMAEPGAPAPENPAENDCWLATTAGALWGVADVAANDFLFWPPLPEFPSMNSGNEDGSGDDSGSGAPAPAWEKLSFNLFELNAALQEKFFTAAHIAINPPGLMLATTVQAAIEELYDMIQE